MKIATMALAATMIAGLAPAAMAQQPAFTVFAKGLDGPRGLRFGPDGLLYVAEAGTGGSRSTGSACEQVPAPVGPYTGGSTGRISRVNKDGSLTTVGSGFPSTQDAMGDLIGVADVAFLNGSLYALVAGGGCSHGNPDSPTGVAKVNTANGQWKLIANVDAFLQAHQAQFENAADFEPDGTLYSLLVFSGKLYTVEPNHGQMFQVTTAGDIKEEIDVSASEGHIVPTSIAVRDGLFYMGNLGVFPIVPQSARVLTIGKPGFNNGNPAPGFDDNLHGYHVVAAKAGFTTEVALDFGPDGLLYVLELSAAPGFPTPGMGKVVRVTSSGDIEDVVTGLAVPTGMTFGPDGRLYISNGGAIPAGAAPAGSGTILQFKIAPGS